MASESELSELSSLFVSFIRNTNTDMSILLPRSRIFTLSTNNDDPLQQSQNTEDSNHQRVILVNPFTQGMIVINGASSLEALLRENSTKIGQPPASKESIEAMKRVEIEDGEEDVGECVVCLEEFEVGGVVREMPCKHRFHGDCIEKWLGIHGSCPVCRFVMPVDEKDDGKKMDEEEGGGERRRVGSEVWISFSFNRNMGNQVQNQNQNQNQHQNQASNGADSTDSTSNSRDDDDAEAEN